MKQYRLPVVMYLPSEETENKYMAEVPILRGCRAWGDTPAEALEIIQDVASKFILSYGKHGQPLPKAVEEAAYELVEPKTATTEVTIYLGTTVSLPAGLRIWAVFGIITPRAAMKCGLIPEIGRELPSPTEAAEIGNRAPSPKFGETWE